MHFLLATKVAFADGVTLTRRARLKSAQKRLKKRSFTDMLRTIVKIQSISQYQKHPNGQAEKIENHFFPNWKQQKTLFCWMKHIVISHKIS